MSIQTDGISSEQKVNPLQTVPIRKLFVQFAVPSTLALVLNAVYNIVDQVFVGWGVGYLGNGATNVIFPLVVFMIALSALFGDGCATFFSLQLGQKKKADAALGVGNMIVVLMTVSIVFTVIVLLFLEPICRIFGATDNILPYAMDYGFIVVLGFPLIAINYSFSALVRADGSPKYSMMGLVLGCVTNIILDPVFIFVFHWGVTGAALATVAGELLNVVLLLLYLKKFQYIDLTKACFRLNGRIIKKILILGSSSFVLQLAVVVLITVINNLQVRYGALSKYGEDIPIAAMGITMKVNSIVINIVQGIAAGTQPVIGFNYGAKQYDRVKQTFRLVVIFTTAAMITAFIVFQFFPMAIVSIFGSESALYNEYAVLCLRVFLMLCPLNGFQSSTGFFLQAVGKPGLSMINALSRQLVLLIPAVVICSELFGVVGTLYGGPIADGLAFLVSVVILKRHWKKIF